MHDHHQQSWATLRTIEQANFVKEIIGWCVLTWCFAAVVCIAMVAL